MKIDFSQVINSSGRWFFEGEEFKMTEEVRRKYDYYRFWSKVDLRANAEICWNWVAAKNSRGYGNVLFKDDTLANRIAYRLYYGNFDKSLCVLHKCDNPSCCNPNHLYLGTKKDNANDKKERGRNASLKGESNGSAKLDNKRVLYILSLLKSGNSLNEISSLNNITNTQVANIRDGKCWSHITGISRIEKQNKRNSGRLFRVYKDGEIVGEWNYHKDCAEKLGLSRPSVTMCLNGSISRCAGYRFEYVK